MADFLTNSLPAYTKEEAAKFFFTPVVMGNNYIANYDVMTNVKSSQALSRVGAASKVTLAYATGFTGVAGPTIDQRVVTVTQMKAEMEENGSVFFNSILGEAAKGGVSKDDFTGTILQELATTPFLNATESDLVRQFYLNDTASGAGANYTAYDGLFKQYASLPAAQKLTGDVGALGAGAASTEFGEMLDAASYELLERLEGEDAALRNNIVLEVSRSLAQNYREELQSKGTEQGNTRLIEGQQQLMWNGIPLVVHTEWDKWISADTLATDVHRAILHTPANVAVGSDLDQVTFELWYNQDEQKVRARFQYVIGVQYKNDELAVTSISA